MNHTNPFKTNTNSSPIKWTEGQVLAQARRLAKEMADSPTAKLQQALAELMARSGWNDDEFVDVLCRDVIRKRTLSVC